MKRELIFSEEAKKELLLHCKYIACKKHNFSLCNISRALPVPFGHLISTARMFGPNLVLGTIHLRRQHVLGGRGVPMDRWSKGHST